MDFDWKKPAIVAAIAFIIAVISAAFGRVGFGALLFRSIIGAIVFGALTVGVEMLARKFLPELFTTTATAAAAVVPGNENEEPSVNITIDEENPHVGEDSLSSIPNIPNAPSGEVSGGNDVTDAEEVEELEVVEDTVEIPSEAPEPGGDAMPSFEEVESTFDTAGANIEESDDDPPLSSVGSQADIDVMGEAQNPEAVARAVRTLLKRDEEG